MSRNKSMRRDQKTLLLAGTSTLILWIVPVLRPIALPLIYLNTHIHELCHALTALLTGGQVSHIDVFADGSGVTPVAGGNLLLTASAGYVGSSIVGGVLLARSRTSRQATGMLWVTFGFLLTSLIIFVRGDLVGIVSGVFWVGLLGVLANKLKADNAVFAVQFLGLQMALTSLQAFLALIQVTTSMERHSDALILEQNIGVPAIAWALGWMVFGLLAIVFALLTAWKPTARK